MKEVDKDKKEKRKKEGRKLADIRGGEVMIKEDNDKNKDV